jgi:uncharacterized membrane protein YbhN (UPF0104 family)
MSRRLWAWARIFGGAAIIGLLLWRLGTGPFLRGLRAVDGWALGVAVAIGVLTTVASAWRWRMVARGLGVRLPLGTAVAAYYRSQFLNTVLPGGVLGDVHRAVRHGQHVGDIGRGVRAVVWERGAGQVVQALVAVLVLLALPSPISGYMPTVTVLAIAAVVVAALVASTVPLTDRASWWARAVRALASDVRDGVLARRTWPGVSLASTVAVAGHLTMFLVAAHVAGSTASLLRLVPLGLLILIAMGLPLNVGGWGPREGAAAWAFGAAGLTADLGVSTAVVYGVLVLVASLPGAVVLLAWRWGSSQRTAASGGAAELAAAGERRLAPAPQVSPAGERRLAPAPQASPAAPKGGVGG